MDQQRPQVLWHYTSNRGLVGMLVEQQLWFSDVRFLNDSREFKHTCELLKSSVHKHGSLNKQKWLDRGVKQESYDLMMHNMETRCDSRNLFAEIARFGHPFVFSLSGEKDILSQWRAYGGGEYCIGFDAEKLCKFHQCNLIEVTYGTVDDNHPQLSINLTRFFEFHLQHIRPGGQIDPEVLADGLNDIKPPIPADEFWFGLKDNAFSEEKEWRLVMRAKPNDPKIFFDSSGRQPTPRLRVGSSEEGKGLVDAICEIVCGPGIDLERSSTAIKMMVSRRSSASIPVSQSVAPYRTN